MMPQISPTPLGSSRSHEGQRGSKHQRAQQQDHDHPAAFMHPPEHRQEC